ncbi:hypothetical protein BJ684DRAFT_20716 [Piptocephalis cylindrospora]|uniref:Uncharacterized protein n=1 Tax=Piptocephalis cylindrospora TaxID=1907219 RepID=A0A4P9Y2G7_9FUNG|nr:hypothetical protein BJ684DRAFT_20716 [Piptocephalis cylindrospora]|eukprot:RKP12762.1 hypothetical protein BJ684DRAFT_20716 [Piptocephalis cylindrospora]
MMSNVAAPLSAAMTLLVHLFVQEMNSGYHATADEVVHKMLGARGNFTLIQRTALKETANSLKVFNTVTHKEYLSGLLARDIDHTDHRPLEYHRFGDAVALVAASYVLPSTRKKSSHEGSPHEKALSNDLLDLAKESIAPIALPFFALQSSMVSAVRYLLKSSEMTEDDLIFLQVSLESIVSFISLAARNHWIQGEKLGRYEAQATFFTNYFPKLKNLVDNSSHYETDQALLDAVNKVIP